MQCNCPPAVLQYTVALCVLYLLLRDIRPMRLWMQVTGRNSAREHFLPKVSNQTLKGIVAVDANNNMVQIPKADFERVIDDKFRGVTRTIESTKKALETTIALVEVTAKDGVARAKAAQTTANGKQDAGHYIVKNSEYRLQGKSVNKDGHYKGWFWMSTAHGDKDMGGVYDSAEWWKDENKAVKIKIV